MRIKLLNTKANLFAVLTIILGYIISFIVILHILVFSNANEFIALTSDNFKHEQIEQIQKKVARMKLIRSYFEEHNSSKKELKVIENTLLDSNFTLGLVLIGKNNQITLGDNSLKFSYNFLSQKSFNDKWFFENLDSNYYMVNVEKQGDDFFIVYQNIMNLIRPKFSENIILDSLYITNSENRSILIAKNKVTETLSKPAKNSYSQRELITHYKKDWFEALNKEFSIKYSMQYTTIDHKILIVFAIFTFFVILSILIYTYGISQNVGSVLKSLIIKMNDFSLNKKSTVILPSHRKDIIGDVIREFEKLVRNISEKNKEINETNKELGKKSSYLSQKMNEIKKLKDMIIKSFNVTNADSMMKELSEMLKDVFGAYGVVLVRNTDGKSKIFHTFNDETISKQKLGTFISTEIGLLISSSSPSIKAKYDDNYQNCNTITFPIKVQSNHLGYLTVFSITEFKDRELDVISTFNSQIGVILENLRLYKEEITKNKLETEFMDAQEIQDILINIGEDARKKIGVETFYLPAENIGGDWFDAVKISEDKFLYMIADITGHGAASALITTMFSTYFKVLQEIFGAKIFDKNDISNLISVLNDVFINLTGGVKNATFAIALYDKTEMTLDYLSAGHNASYLYDSAKRKITTLQVKNIRLGDDKKAVYNSKKYKISKGDVLFMYTDGLIENNMTNGKEYSKKRLQGFLKRDLTKNDERNFKQILKKDIDNNIDLKNLNDDVTFIVAKL